MTSDANHRSMQNSGVLDEMYDKYCSKTTIKVFIFIFHIQWLSSPCYPFAAIVQNEVAVV